MMSSETTPSQENQQDNLIPTHQNHCAEPLAARALLPAVRSSERARQTSRRGRSPPIHPGSAGREFLWERRHERYEWSLPGPAGFPLASAAWSASQGQALPTSTALIFAQPAASANSPTVSLEALEQGDLAFDAVQQEGDRPNIIHIVLDG